MLGRLLQLYSVLPLQESIDLELCNLPRSRRAGEPVH